MFQFDTRYGQAVSLSLTDDTTAAQLVASAGLGHSYTDVSVEFTADDLRGLAAEALAMADEIDCATIAAEVAADIDGPAADWPGRRVAVESAGFWHAARDNAPATVCGLGLAVSGLDERHVTKGQAMCPGCCNVVTAALVSTGQLDPEAAQAALQDGAPGATPADYVQIARWGKFMLSTPWYIKAQQAQAHADRAPVDAIYQSGDTRQGGRWVTAREVTNPLALVALTEPAGRQS